MQVALQLAYSVLEMYPNISVSWIQALSLETFERACIEVAGVLGIPGTEDGKEDARKLIQRHLSKKMTGKWMLVVDNADDVEVVRGSDSEEGILDYLLKSELGFTVFTTRDKKTAQAVAGSSTLGVEKLKLMAAFDLFKKMLTRKDLLYEEATVSEFLMELDFLPLVIAYRQLERVDSQPFGQVDDHGAASPSATESIAELEKLLPRQSQKTRHPNHNLVYL